MSMLAYAPESHIDPAKIYVQATAASARDYAEHPGEEGEMARPASLFAHAIMAQPAFTPTVGIVEASLLAVKKEIGAFVRRYQRAEEAESAVDPDVAFLLPASRSINIQIRIVETGLGQPSAVFDPEDFEVGSPDL